MNNKKCSSKEHLDIDAVKYCDQCEIFMCNTCNKIHSNLCSHHFQYNVNKDNNEEFTGLCKKNKHYQNKLEYFDKSHNILCCVACIANYLGEEKGKHRKCSICFNKEIKDEKREIYEKSFKYLEEISFNLEKSIGEIKSIFNKLNKSKTVIKKNIQEIFTKIREKLNEREDQLLMMVDDFFDDYYCKEDIIKILEKLPNKIKISLEKGKNKESSWDDNNKLSSLINDCIILENYIELINLMNMIIQKYNENNSKIHLTLNEEKINDFLKEIEIFGNITHMNFKFKKILNQSDEITLALKGTNHAILTKTTKNYFFGNQKNFWSGAVFENPLDNIIYNCKIKKLNSYNDKILIGIVPIDFDLTDKYINQNEGLFFYFYDLSFYSTIPQDIVLLNNQKKNFITERINQDIIISF